MLKCISGSSGCLSTTKQNMEQYARIPGLKEVKPKRSQEQICV